MRFVLGDLTCTYKKTSFKTTCQSINNFTSFWTTLNECNVCFPIAEIARFSSLPKKNPSESVKEDLNLVKGN